MSRACSTRREAWGSLAPGGARGGAGTTGETKGPWGQGSAGAQGWDADPLMPGGPQLQQSEELSTHTPVS